MNDPTTDIDRRMQDEQGFLAAVRDARIDALRRHARAGVPAVVWRDGRIVQLPAEILLAIDPPTHRSGESETAA